MLALQTDIGVVQEHFTTLLIKKATLLVQMLTPRSSQH